jgi:hypothetical protein
VGTDFNAFIEYDYSEDASEPFTTEDIASVSWDKLFLDKGYAFIGAISSIRSSNPPLIQPRGLPPTLSIAARSYFRNQSGSINGVSPGWLYLDELKSCLTHASISMQSLDPEYQVLLTIMEALELKFGHHRTRLVFTFD